MDPWNFLLPFQDLDVSPIGDPLFTPTIQLHMEPLDVARPFPPISQPTPTNSTFSQTTPQSFLNLTTSSIIHVPNLENQITARSDLKTNKYLTRSSELVRFTNLTSDVHHYHRNLILKTRRIFDSLCVFYLDEYKKSRQSSEIDMGKTCGANKTGSFMRHQGFWMNKDKRIVGNIPGVLIGDIFLSRIELCVIGLHGHVQAGIDYVPASQCLSGKPIATSVIVSGGYEDDDDKGDVIVYTGHGGQDRKNRQISDQEMKEGNLALEISRCYGIEVRVIRGLKNNGMKVYVYDGLYRIVESSFDVGISGFRVYKFRLVRITNQGEMGSEMVKLASSLKVHPSEFRGGYVSFDLSNKRERLPVYFYNDIDQNHDPLDYEYLVSSIFPPHVFGYGSSIGCECVGGCTNNCFCALRNVNGFAYDCNGTLLRGKPLVIECGPHCRCPVTCRNRVTQKGTNCRFEVFRSKRTTWGVRSLDLIKAGSFICEYAGFILTRDQPYLFTRNGDNLVYSSRFAERWKEWGDLSQVFPNYICPTSPSIPPLDFAMDVSRFRNVACYISHSSTPNVFVQPVLFDHNNASFPRLMLFAMETIPPMRELSLDYGVADKKPGNFD